MENLVKLPNNFLKGIDKLLIKDKSRAIMQNVYFNNGFAYATDSIVAVKIDLAVYNLKGDDKHIFDGMYLSATGLTDLKAKRNDRLIAEKGKISLWSGKNKRYTVELIPEEDIGKYPNIEAVIPQKADIQGISRISFNAQKLLDVQKVYETIAGIYRESTSDNRQLILNFFAENRPILITNFNDTFKAAVMPRLMPKMQVSAQ